VPVVLDVRLNGRCSPRRRGRRVLHHRGRSPTRPSTPEPASAGSWCGCATAARSGPGSRTTASGRDRAPGGGLDGIGNRVLAAGGTFRLDSPVGGPTSLEVSVPCAS
jgi:hypothetical protein